MLHSFSRILSATPFRLSRWFAVVGLIAIVLLSVTCAELLSILFTNRMLGQEGALTTQFVQNIIDVERASLHFESTAKEGPELEQATKLKELLQHFAALPDVLRVNLYSPEHRILWSSDPTLVGRSFSDNPELDSALSGHTEVESGPDPEPTKAEHENLQNRSAYFVEIYLPVWDDTKRHVVGVVELYRTPHALFEAIQTGRRVIWFGALIAGALLYAALFSLVRRADNIIVAQQERLVEAERLGIVGEMASAVAHGIRNPLAVIRSSAELIPGSDSKNAGEAVHDIISQVDRVEQWIRSMLAYAQPTPDKAESISLHAAVAENLLHFSRELDRRGIICSTEIPADLPPLRADPLLIDQVIHSVITNAMEAIQRDGRIVIKSAMDRTHRCLRLSIQDDGPGMSSEQLRLAFKPFHTTKTNGVGLGLPIAKRIVERFNGRIRIISSPGNGTTVELMLPTV